MYNRYSVVCNKDGQPYVRSMWGGGGDGKSGPRCSNDSDRFFKEKFQISVRIPLPINLFGQIFACKRPFLQNLRLRLPPAQYWDRTCDRTSPKSPDLKAWTTSKPRYPGHAIRPESHAILSRYSCRLGACRRLGDAPAVCHLHPPASDGWQHILQDPAL